MAMEAARSTAQTCGAARTQLQRTMKVAEVTGEAWKKAGSDVKD